MEKMTPPANTTHDKNQKKSNKDPVSSFVLTKERASRFKKVSKISPWKTKVAMIDNALQLIIDNPEILKQRSSLFDSGEKEDLWKQWLEQKQKEDTILLDRLDNLESGLQELNDKFSNVMRILTHNKPNLKKLYLTDPGPGEEDELNFSESKF